MKQKEVSRKAAQEEEKGDSEQSGAEGDLREKPLSARKRWGEHRQHILRQENPGNYRKMIIYYIGKTEAEIATLQREMWDCLSEELKKVK